jgi:molecular chaperone HtpG
MEHQEGANTKLICQQLYELAQIQNAPLSAEDMASFIVRSNEIMLMLTKGAEAEADEAPAEEPTEE